MKGEALVPTEPFNNLGVLVGRIVVEHDVDLLVGRNLFVDGVQGSDELLMSMALHAPADHAAFEHVEGGEQGGRAIPLVVVGHAAATAFLQRQARLGAVESLDLALLVHRQHDGMLRRIDVEADDVADLCGEVRIVGQLELPDLMRPQTVATPDAVHRTDADRADLGHGGGGPMRKAPVKTVDANEPCLLALQKLLAVGVAGAAVVEGGTGGAIIANLSASDLRCAPEP